MNLISNLAGRARGRAHGGQHGRCSIGHGGTYGTWVKEKDRVMRKPAKRMRFSTLNRRASQDGAGAASSVPDPAAETESDRVSGPGMRGVVSFVMAAGGRGTRHREREGAGKEVRKREDKAETRSKKTRGGTGKKIKVHGIGR